MITEITYRIGLCFYALLVILTLTQAIRITRGLFLTRKACCRSFFALKWNSFYFQHALMLFISFLRLLVCISRANLFLPETTFVLTFQVCFLNGAHIFMFFLFTSLINQWVRLTSGTSKHCIFLYLFNWIVITANISYAAPVLLQIHNDKRLTEQFQNETYLAYVLVMGIVYLLSGLLFLTYGVLLSRRMGFSSSSNDSTTRKEISSSSLHQEEIVFHQEKWVTRLCSLPSRIQITGCLICFLSFIQAFLFLWLLSPTCQLENVNIVFIINDFFTFLTIGMFHYTVSRLEKNANKKKKTKSNDEKCK